MGIPDHWIKLLKHSRDEEWNLEEIWSVLVNRRYGEKTIAYAESHDQALVGDKTLAFRLMDKEMYFHMDKGDPHPVIERGIALHKIIRLVTLAAGGEGWLNFMGNEFGHPEWLDFPREGNGWSYHYCRRQWSLVDNPGLKYDWLGDFDRALVKLAREAKLLESDPAQYLFMDHGRKILCFERANLIFVVNFSVDQSAFDFAFPVHGKETRQLVLDSDGTGFGGHGRVDQSFDYPIDAEGNIHVYSPSRSALVFAKI